MVHKMSASPLAIPALIDFTSALGESVLDHPREDRRVAGIPDRYTWELYEKPGCSIGIWSCTPGAWRIVFPPTREEYFHVLEGRLRITSATGDAHIFGPGEACVIPAGFEGVFEVIETVRKHYVLIDRAEN